MDLEALAGVDAAVDAVQEAVIEAQLATVLDGGETATPAWVIMSLRQADWAMQRVADIEAQQREYAAEVARWQNAAQRLARAKAWLDDRLKAWALANRTAARKTFLLAHGTVATRAGRQRVVVVDEEAAIVWAKEHCPEAVQVTEKLLVSRLNAKVAAVDELAGLDQATGEVTYMPVLAAVDPNGDPIPGLDVEVGEATATVVPLGA